MRLDILAALFTMSSTALLAWDSRWGFVTLSIGSILWFFVAKRARYHGRPVVGQMVASAWTLVWSAIGWATWN